MGLFDQLFGRRNAVVGAEVPRTIDTAVGARDESDDVSMTFNDRNITFTGSLRGFDYEQILRDKQANIQKLFQLSDYFVDADPIYRGIIKEVYTPFSIADDFKLIGADEAVKQKYLKYYERIHLRDKMTSIFLQYYKYGNVYCYLMDNGNLITLPVHYIRIANVMVDGEPVLEFHCSAVRDDLIPQGIEAKKDYLEDADLDVRLRGFPKEVAEGIKAGREYVQLDPRNTFVLQDLKEDWVRYAVPIVASCLKAFAKKELISDYENALINLAKRSFVHVKYGDPKNEVMPTGNELRQVDVLFKRAMTGSALATTNNWCEAEVVQPGTDDMFEYDKYKGVNSDILSAGGISGIIVSGRAEDGSTFASAQVSMQTAAMRIRQAKDNFCEMMDKINRRLNESNPAITRSKRSSIPRFTFPPVDLSGSKAFQDACMKLWEKGMVSNETLLQAYGYDMGQEIERKRKEEANGTTEVLTPPNQKEEEDAAEETTIGRPALEDYERHSDPSKSVTGRAPKGSNPDGSEAQTE